MKRLKFLLTGLCAVILALGCFAFAACGDGEPEYLSGSMEVVLSDPDDAAKEKVYEVDLSLFTAEDSAEAVLNYLTKEKDFYYEGYRGGYGLFLTAAGYRYTPENSTYEQTAYVVKQDASAGKYLYIYTNVDVDKDTSEWAYTVEYGGLTLTSANVGISLMHIQDGAVVYISTIVWG